MGGCWPDPYSELDDMKFNKDLVEFCTFRLLLFVLAVSHLCMTVICASVGTYDEHVSNEVSNPEEGVLKYVRQYKLFNMCSNNYLQINGKGRVYAKRKAHSKRAIVLYEERDNLRVETDTFKSQIRIQSARHHTYICFNKKGRLIVRQSGQNKRCVFREIHTMDNYAEFQSVYNPDWFIGFKKNGKPLKGKQWKSMRRGKECYRFLKMEDDSYIPPSTGRKGRKQTYGPKVNWDFYTRNRGKT